MWHLTRTCCGGGFSMLNRPLLLIALSFLALAIACSAGTPLASGPSTLSTPVASGPSSLSSPSPLASSPAPTQMQPQEQTSSCLGADGIREIRAEYAANPIRAQETYIGQRLCLRGTISSFNEVEHSNEDVNYIKVNAAIGDEARFSVGPPRQDQRWPDGLTRRGWRAWILTTNVGDVVEADCWIEALKSSPRENPKRTPGTPLFRDCRLLIAGGLWTPPPDPTPTPIPCIKAEFGDRSEEQWLTIDCPAGKVTVGLPSYLDELLSFGDSVIIAFYFDVYRDGVSSRDSYDHSSPWKRRVEAPQGERGATEIWEAPPDIAAIFISLLRRSGVEAVSLAIGECCSEDVHFLLFDPNAE